MAYLIKNILFKTCTFIALLFLYACSTSYNDPQLLSEFHTKYVWKPSTEAKTNDSLDVYLDYSSGMYEAMYASLNIVINDVLNIAKDEKTKFYRAGAALPYLIDIEANDNIPSTTTNYKENRSVLDEPIRRIVKGNKQGVFITDFEFVPTGQKIFEAAMSDGSRIKTWVNTDAWATNLFEEWLKKGNQIDIYACKFKEKQFLYVLVFTPQSFIGKDNAFITRLKQLNERLSDSFYHFSFFNLKAINSAPQGYDPTFGGLNENLAALDFVYTPERHFEYYELPLKDIETYINSETTVKDKRILRKIFLEGDIQFFDNIELELKTYRITNIFDLYQQSQNQAPPQYEIDPETGDSTLVSGQQMVFSYTEGEEVKDVFDIAFNKENKEMGIKVRPDFYGTDNKNELYRIDIVLKNAVFKESPEMSKVLQWKDKQGFIVRSLYESIGEAMRRTEKLAKNKVLYRYYLKLDF
ncbi:MAG: hypothetical protein MUE81_09745 [Thermoflexibacter sp.]|jgi:hypothetical protein|nr:hypothetical protein [Thermoflexibacter sp.]